MKLPISSVTGKQYKHPMIKMEKDDDGVMRQLATIESLDSLLRLTKELGHDVMVERQGELTIHDAL